MPGDLLVWGPCQEPSKQHTTEVPTLQCPGSGTCSGTLTFPALRREVLGPLHWEAQKFPHVQTPCVTLPLGLGMCRAFLQRGRGKLDVSEAFWTIDQTWRLAIYARLQC